jgi:hypothetical protein
MPLDHDTAAAFSAVADAIETERALLDPACETSYPDDPLFDLLLRYRDRSRARLDARLRAMSILGPYLTEATVGGAVGEILGLRRVRERCGRKDTGSTVYAQPPVPWCVAREVVAEVEAANALASWGYDAAADALASAATRWADARCPRREPPGSLPPDRWMEPILCDCGGRPTAPMSLAAGYWVYPEHEPPGSELGQWVHAGTCDPTGLPYGRCPGFCREVRWARAGSRRARRAAHGPLQVTRPSDDSPLTVFSEQPGLSSADLGTFADQAELCSDGAAEWLGSWVPWDDRPGSACLADAASALFPTGEWLVVEVR